MQLLIFDMDGVLLHSHGYHRAMQETVRLAGEAVGLPGVQLTDEQVLKFEALGLSSEWHSSALCLGVILIGQQSGNLFSAGLDLQPLFEALAAQPVADMPRTRALKAITILAQEAGVEPGNVQKLIEESEQIERSATINWFQELVLGSEYFHQVYRRQPQFSTDSYLQLYDERRLCRESAAQILTWAEAPEIGAVIMTNRPSFGLNGAAGMPDASFGAALVGLEDLLVIGSGEMEWLAVHTSRDLGLVIKPSREHGLAAILTAGGWSEEASLRYLARGPENWHAIDLAHLRGSRVTVFEDAPGGLVAVQGAVNTLNQLGLEMTLRKIGIASGPAKRNALADQGAEVFEDIEQALSSL